MVRCTFCNKEIDKGTGFMYVQRNGKIYNYCSQKCKKNMLNNKRVGKKLKWTEFVQDKKRQLRKRAASKDTTGTTVETKVKAKAKVKDKPVTKSVEKPVTKPVVSKESAKKQ